MLIDVKWQIPTCAKRLNLLFAQSERKALRIFDYISLTKLYYIQACYIVCIMKKNERYTVLCVWFCHRTQGAQILYLWTWCMLEKQLVNEGIFLFQPPLQVILHFLFYFWVAIETACSSWLEAVSLYTFCTVGPHDLLDDSTVAALSGYRWNMYWGKDTFIL